MHRKYASKQPIEKLTAWLSMDRKSNQYGEFCYVLLQWRIGKKLRGKSLGPVDEQNPTLTLDATIRAIDLKLLNVDELLRLRSANKAARW